MTTNQSWRIANLRKEIEDACEYVRGRDGIITTGSYGTEPKNLVVAPGRCYCPIGALELLRKQCRETFTFNYDVFVEGFDTELFLPSPYDDALPWSAALFELGRDFRKKYLGKAA